MERKSWGSYNSILQEAKFTNFASSLGKNSLQVLNYINCNYLVMGLMVWENKENKAKFTNFASSLRKNSFQVLNYINCNYLVMGSMVWENKFLLFLFVLLSFCTERKRSICHNVLLLHATDMQSVSSYYIFKDSLFLYF